MTVLRKSPSGPGFLLTSSEVANESVVTGSTVTQALDTLANEVDVVTDESLYDEFIGGRADTVTTPNGNAGIGELNWGYALTAGTGSVERASTVQDTAGAYIITTDAGGNLGGIYLGDVTGTPRGIPLGNIDWAEFIAILDPGANVDAQCSIGLGSSIALTQLGQDALFFNAGPLLSTGFIRAIVRDASVNTTTAPSSVLATTRARLRLTRLAAQSWAMSVNGEIIATASGPTVPADSILVNPMIQTQSSAGNAQALIIDTFRMKLTAGS